MQELRRSARYSVACTVSARELSDAGDVQKDVIRGELRDISKGGFCLMSGHPYQVSSVLRCEIFFPDFPVGVPTLARVRWIRQESQSEFRSGLQFLLE